VRSENGKLKAENGMRNAFRVRNLRLSIINNSVFCSLYSVFRYRRHSEGGKSRPKNPLPCERVESLKFTKSEFTKFRSPFSVFRFPIGKKLTLFC